MPASDKQTIEQLIGDLDRLVLAESNWERAEFCGDRNNTGPRNAMREHWTKEQREAAFAQLVAEREPYRREADQHKQTVLALRESIGEKLDRAISIAAKAKESSNDLRVLQRNMQHLYPEPVFADGKLVSRGCFIDADLRDYATSFLKDLLIRLPIREDERGDEGVSPAARAFQRQQFRKAMDELFEQGQIEYERDLAEMRKQPGFAPMLADPLRKQLDADCRSTVEKYRQRRAKWRGKFYEDLSPQEQDEERQLTNEQEREMSELRWRSHKLQQVYGVHSPDPLRRPDQLVKSIRVWQMWAETLIQSGDNQNRYATERAAEARKAALLLRQQFPSLASVPPPLGDAMHDLGVLLDWAITSNRDVNEWRREAGMFPDGPDGPAMKIFSKAIETNRPVTKAEITEILAEHAGTKSTQAKSVDIAYLSHAAAFAMLRIGNKTSKEASKIMASIRQKAGQTLICRKAGNEFKYEPECWNTVVKLIGKAGGIENYTPTGVEIAEEKVRIRREKGH
jgi:hypothetical protein